MSGLDYLGAEEVGGDFNYMDLAKAGTGLLQGFGGMFGGGGGGGAGAPSAQQAALEKQKLEEEKRKAEQSAANMKLALGIGGGAVFVTILMALLLRGK